MSLPESVQHKLPGELSKDHLLTQKLADQISSSIHDGSPVNWNLILTAQLEHEKGDANEA